MTITVLPARNEYTATSSQTVFNYTFKIFANTDLNVYITPAGQEANDATDLTTAFTVDAGTIGDEDGGFLTMDVGVTAGYLVTIVSDVPESRTTDYQFNGDFIPDTVNDDFDRVVQLTKQVEDTAGRTLTFQQSQQNATALALPEPVATLFLRWRTDLAGLENVDLSIGGAPTDASLVTYDPPFTGSTLSTVETKLSERVSILDFGALVNGVADDSAAWQAAIDHVLGAGGGVVSMGEGISCIGTQLLVDNDNLTIVGAGQQASTFKALAGNTGAMMLVRKTGDYIDKAPVIHDIGFDGDNIAEHAMDIDSSANGEVYRVQMDNFNGHCVRSKPNQTPSRFSEFWYFHDIKWKESLGWGDFAAADSQCTDFDIHRVRGGGPNFLGWGMKIEDCSRFTVRDFGAFNNGTVGFLGGILITAPGTASGAPATDVFGHDIESVEVENNVGGAETAEGVVIDADGTNRIRSCVVGGVRMTPTSLIAIRFSNSSGTANQNRGNRINHAPIPYGTGEIQIDANVKRAIISYQTDISLDTALVNNGAFTLVNGTGEESNNAPTPDAAQWDVGDYIDFTDTRGSNASGSGLYLMLQNGTLQRISVKEAHAIEIQSGTGAATEFTIAHGLGTKPSFVNVTADSVDSAGTFRVSANATDLFIRYTSGAPANGVNNLTWWWKAEV